MKSTGMLMASEMAEQPEVLGSLLRRRAHLMSMLRSVILEKPAGCILIARGSSDHAALYGRYVLELATRRPATLAAPSLVTIYGSRTDYSGFLAVALSQSGQTPEVVTVARAVRRSGATLVVITNDDSSPLAQNCDAVVSLGAGVERAVPATKTFTAELAALAIVADAVGSPPWDLSDLNAVPRAVAEVLSHGEEASRIAAAVAERDRVVTTARGLLYCIAKETALKVGEATGVLAQAYSVGDLRHGPVAALDEGVPVVGFRVRGRAGDDVASFLTRLRAEGVPVFLCADSNPADMSLPLLPEGLAPLVAAVRAQQLAYHLAQLKGLDPDAPKGLRKVTPTF